MPQSNRRVSNVDLRGDMNNYYRYSVATYLKPTKNGVERLAAYIHGYDGANNELQVLISTMGPNDKTWGDQKYVPNDAMCYELPNLGSVKHNGEWIHLVRSPQRRMRKGYNEECIHWTYLDGANGQNDHSVLEETVIKQVWYGCDERLSTNVVLESKRIYFKAEHVANVSDDGSILFIPNKEKLGEFVCKLLASNWEEVRSKNSNLTLP